MMRDLEIPKEYKTPSFILHNHFIIKNTLRIKINSFNKDHKLLVYITLLLHKLIRANNRCMVEIRLQIIRTKDIKMYLVNNYG